MTDRTIDSSIFDATDEYNFTPACCFTTQNIGYAAYVDSNGDIVLAKTTDGGTNWTSANTTIDSNENYNNVGIWYESWTPNDSGTKILLAFAGPADDLKFSYFDTNGESVRSGGTVTVADLGAFAPNDGGPSICKATDGDLYITGNGNNGTLVYRSTDGGDNWSDISDATHNSTLDDDTDYVCVVPLSGGDIMLVVHDNSADDWKSRVWDIGTTSWDASFTTIYTPSQGVFTRRGNVTIDHSGNVYIASPDLNTTGAYGGGLRVFKWFSGSWSEKTAVIGNTSELKFGFAIAVDTTTGDLYAMYTRGSTGSMDCYYVKSTNDGSTWGSEQQLSSTTDDLRYCRPSTPAIGDDRIYAVWYNDDLNDMIGESIAAIASSGITGTSATTNANDTNAATGTVEITGTSATTNSDDTNAASGSIISSGTSATTNADDTNIATGTVKHVGTSNTTNADDINSASGTITVSGTSTTTNADDTNAASGTVSDADIVGSSATTNADDTNAATGNLKSSGSSSTTNADDINDAIGSVSGADIFGSSDTTNGDDVNAATGILTVSGTSTTTNTDDTNAAAGIITISGTSSTNNADDTNAASGIVSGAEIFGSSSTTNADDINAAAGTITVSGSIAVANDDDVNSASGIVVGAPIEGTAAIVNADDVSSGYISVTLPITDVSPQKVFVMPSTAKQIIIPHTRKTIIVRD